jgi:hypothetical protein
MCWVLALWSVGVLITDVLWDIRNQDLITDCVTGWFALLTPKGQLEAPCYSTVQQLITAQVTRFLTKTQLTAYKLNDSKGNASNATGMPELPSVT